MSRFTLRRPLGLLALEHRLAPATLLHTVNNPTPATDDEFGWSSAVSGKYMVIGAKYDNTGATDAGSAYVYDLSSATPATPIATLNNPSPATNDWFGGSVSVSGKYVVVGAAANDTSAIDAGSAYVYDLNSMTPTTPIATLNNPDATPASDIFGKSVAVWGTYVVVGAVFDDPGALSAGSAYVYDLSSSSPTTPIATLHNPNPAAQAYFGFSVTMLGNYVAVGATNGGIDRAGAAYVYDLNSPTPTTPIFTLDDPSSAFADYFGVSISMSGNCVVVGASQDDSVGNNAGAAYVYDLSSMTPTTPIAALFNPGLTSLDYFGISVSVSNNYVVVAASDTDTGAIDAGSAYVYDLSSMTPETPIATLNNPSPATNDYFGTSVAVSGNYVVVGANLDDGQFVDQGRAYVYTLAPVKVAAVKINGNASQRSRVTSLEFDFDQTVTFSGLPADAFQLKRQGDDETVAVSAKINNPPQGTIITLTFAGGPVDFGSLADGRYTLTIFADQVSNSNGQLDGNGDGVPGDNYTSPASLIFRLFGDADGDGDVDVGDFAALRAVFGGTSSIFDFDNDGDVDTSDFGLFRARFGATI